MVKIAVYGKGGIGKSTMSANITAALSDRGHRVLQIGCDPKHDSTRLLLGGKLPQTILEYMKDVPESRRKLSDVILEGYKGCLCAESGGPEPGVGCAGRGIISAFNLLSALGVDSLHTDITLYDVLGDVVCGGFAVPIRNEYADRIFIVSSGEFMSIYAANNILRGVSNYDPRRIGGIIFNSRGGPEEPERIKRFSDAVGIPIVATFSRSKLFSDAEENGKTVVEMFPESREAETFGGLCDTILNGELHTARYLQESELESVVLGRSVVHPVAIQKKAPESVKTEIMPKKRYTSRNVENHEIYTGCAFAGAQSVSSSIPGMATVLHSPTDCAQFAFQMVSSSAKRAHMFGSLPVSGFLNPEVACTDMDESDMVFGGTPKLKETLESVIGEGYKMVSVITSCASGIIGDDTRNAIAQVESEHPDVRIALIEEDGDINGDFMQGVIDAGVALSRRFALECEKTDSVNVIGTKTISTNCMETESMVRSALESIGIKLNCSYPGCGDAGDIQHLTAAKYNLMLNPDRFTKQLCQQLEDDFGIPCLKNIVRPGLSGLRAWLGEVAEVFGRQKEFEAYMKVVESEYAESAKTIPATLRGKTVCILSITKDVEWLIEGALSAGMRILDVTVLNRTYYSNDLDLPTKYPFIKIVEEDDLVKAVTNVASIGADIVLSSARLPKDIVQVPIPMVQEDDPFFAVRYFTKIARRLMAPAQPGWRDDVVRS